MPEYEMSPRWRKDEYWFQKSQNKSVWNLCKCHLCWARGNLCMLRCGWKSLFLLRLDILVTLAPTYLSSCWAAREILHTWQNPQASDLQLLGKSIHDFDPLSLEEVLLLSPERRYAWNDAWSLTITLRIFLTPKCSDYIGEI